MYDVIIDTDPGFDDFLAIILAAKSRLLRIKAVTTVAGNSNIEDTTRNAEYALRLSGRRDIPLYSGSDRPLKRDLITGKIHGKEGLYGMNPIKTPKLTGNAVEKMLSIIRNNPYRITLITLGPLTNVARAILKDSKTMAKLKNIVMMGGAIRVPGNKNRVAEFNLFVDPEAADVVFRFPVDKLLVPLDACNKVRLQLADFRRIKNRQLRGLLVVMAKPYIDYIFAGEGIKAAIVYDPLTVYSILKPKACTNKPYNIQIETKGELTRGMSVAELRRSKQEKPNINVIENISEYQFKRDFVRYLSSD